VDRALVYQTDNDGPGTHVLLIGIGAYSHLLDGVEEKLELADGMGQLDAPPLSVKAIADWFMDGSFINEERPFTSLALVISEDEPCSYGHANANRGGHDLPIGNAADVVDAIRHWVTRASSHRDNQIIFYFCGHGVFSGNSVLLCRDYGAVDEDRFEGALNFDTFIQGIWTKVPEYQVLFADACRTPYSVVDLLTRNQSAGRNSLTPSPLVDRGGTPAKQSIHLATSDLSASYGRTRGASIYAEALLRAMSGGGAQSEYGMWVGTDGLQNALGTYTARLAEREGVEQEPDRIRSGRFKVHKPAQIEVPLYLTCDPSEAWECAFEVKASALTGLDTRTFRHDPAEVPDRQELELVVPVNQYRVVATFEPGAPFSGGSSLVIAHPPEAPLCLPITRVA
jgi:Caspase domain